MPKNKPVERGPRSGAEKTPSSGPQVPGESRAAKGGPAGAHQGGASRGGSRVEPSHTQRTSKKDRGKK